MIITRDYRLAEQGGYIFREDKRDRILSDMRGDADNARLEAAYYDKKRGRKSKTEDKTFDVW
jgi:hypothetical protein